MQRWGYRSWSGSLAIQVAMTSLTCGDTLGWVIEGRGGGALRCATTSPAIVSPAKGGSPARHSYSTQANE